MEEPVQRNIDHMLPLFPCHPGHWRILVYARIIDDDLNRPSCEKLTKRLGRRSRIDDIEPRHAGRPTVRNNLLRHLFSCLGMPVSMHDDGITVSGQPLANDGTDGTASACHEGTFAGHDDTAFTKIDARPSMIARASCMTTK